MGTKNENISAQAFLERLSRTAVKPRAEKASGRKPDVNAVLSALGIPVGSQDAPGKVSGKPAPQAGANPEAKLGEKPAAQTEIAALISRAKAMKQKTAPESTPMQQVLEERMLELEPLLAVGPLGKASPFEISVIRNTQSDTGIFGKGQFISSEDMGRRMPEGHEGPLRVAAYIRVSSDSAAQEDSYEIQEQYFSQLLAQNGNWISAGVYSDYGVSATSGDKRTGYKRLLRHCREGKVDRIVCKSISRFSRNTNDFLMAMKLLKQCGVTILFEREALDTAEQYSEFIVTTLAAIAQEESRSISTNLLWGNSKRFPEGKVRNIDVYGYRFPEGEDAYMVTADGYRLRRVEIVEEEAEVVRRVFQEFVDGSSPAQIARGLNRDHIPSPVYEPFSKNTSGGRKMPDGKLKEGLNEGWTTRNVRMILEKERYTGDVLVQKSITTDHLTHTQKVNEGEMPQYLVRDHHPAIINRELFEEAKRIRGMGKRPGQGERRQYAFAGRLVCASCGRHYHVNGGRANNIWKCASTTLNNGKTICHAEKVYEEQLIRMFRKAVTERFQLIEGNIRDDVAVADIMSGRYMGDSVQFTDSATQFVRQMRERLERMQQADFIERDRSFMKQQMLALQVSIDNGGKALRRLRTQAETMEVRRSLLGEEIDTALLAGLRGQIGEATEKLEEEEAEFKTLSDRLSYMEEYWDALEDDYEWREKAIAWMEGLPLGPEGMVEFLNGMTSEYVKAFAISITIHDPLHYTVHWFDDTRTDVEMYSNIEDYRYTAAYFNGHKMVQKRERRRKKINRKVE